MKHASWIFSVSKVEFSQIASGLPGVADAELSALKADIASERIRREAVEMLGAERLAHIEDLRRMLPGPDAKPRRWWPW